MFLKYDHVILAVASKETQNGSGYITALCQMLYKLTICDFYTSMKISVSKGKVRRTYGNVY